MQKRMSLVTRLRLPLSWFDAQVPPSDGGDDNAVRDFPDDLDVTVDFYIRVLRFRLTADRRNDPSAYVSLQRVSVHVGAARRIVPDARAARLPPAGVELVLEVDDVAAAGPEHRADRGHQPAAQS